MSRSRFLFLSSLFATLVFPLVAQQRSRPPRPRAPRAGPPFEIVACSLGCVRGPDGFGCTETAIHVNEELRFTFSQPLDPASVNTNSFRIVDQTGRTPAGSFRLDAQDPGTLVYRPQMSFDSAGNPIFGLMDDQTYLLHLRGTDQDAVGPYLTSVDGVPNRTRLLCTLVASEGVGDPVPGRPVAKLYVQAVLERDPVSGEPVRTGRVPAANATDVLRSSPIELVFGDLMNPATLANPVTGTSSFLRVFFDPDGDVRNVSDWVSVPGSFQLTLNQCRLTTHVFFRATGGLPASGSQRQPGRVVFQISPQVSDVAANTVFNPGVTSFVTEAR